MKTGKQRGFSLLEMLASLAILSIVFGVIVEGITTMQERNFVETNKLDLTQESREFMDQIVNDLDQVGFPSMIMFVPAALASKTDCTQDANVACGFISVTTNAIQFEGDVDGTGVSEEWIQLVNTNGPGAVACTTPPCVIQRGTLSKSAWILAPGTFPPFYTEVNGVMNTTVFSAFKADGTPATLPAVAGNGNLPGITAIGITLYVKSSQPDPKTGLYPTVTMVSTAKINNIQWLN